MSSSKDLKSISNFKVISYGIEVLSKEKYSKNKMHNSSINQITFQRHQRVRMPYQTAPTMARAFALRQPAGLRRIVPSIASSATPLSRPQRPLSRVPTSRRTARPTSRISAPTLLTTPGLGQTAGNFATFAMQQK